MEVRQYGPLISTTELGHRLGISVERARRLILSRHLGELRGGRLFVTEEEVAHLESERTAAPSYRLVPAGGAR